MTAPFELLSSPAEIAALAVELRSATTLALDTEFHGEKFYSPKLMLVQIATPSRIVIVDPLGEGDLKLLFGAIHDSGAEVVGHALKHDLLILWRSFGLLPKRVFDTQVAAAFVGHGETVGLGKLLQTELGVTLEKAHTMANWESRPLPPAQLAYAAADVVHLLALADRLRARLTERGRITWVEEDCLSLLDSSNYELPAVENAWLQVKRRRPGSGRETAVLQALAAERERLARKQDVPAVYILPDDLLLDLAARKPLKDSDIVGSTHRRRSPGLEQHVRRWITAIRHGLDAPPVHQEELEPSLSPAQEAVAALATLFVRHIASSNDIAGGRLRVDKGVEELIRRPAKDEADFKHRLGLTGWRSSLAEAPLRELLSGRLRLGAKLQNGQFEFVSEPVD